MPMAGVSTHLVADVAPVRKLQTSAIYLLWPLFVSFLYSYYSNNLFYLEGGNIMKELFEELFVVFMGLFICVLIVVAVYTIIIKFNT